MFLFLHSRFMWVYQIHCSIRARLTLFLPIACTLHKYKSHALVPKTQNISSLTLVNGHFMVKINFLVELSYSSVLIPLNWIYSNSLFICCTFTAHPLLFLHPLSLKWTNKHHSFGSFIFPFSQLSIESYVSHVSHVYHVMERVSPLE